MVALTAERSAPRKDGRDYNDPVEAATKIFGGSLVCLNAAGNATKGATALNLKAIGRARATADNTAGAAGALAVETETGVFRFANSAAGDLIARADLLADCYIVDDQTVAKTTGGATRSIAGKIVDVDANGVWVRLTR
jgi:hypothetical protein